MQDVILTAMFLIVHLRWKAEALFLGEGLLTLRRIVLPFHLPEQCFTNRIPQNIAKDSALNKVIFTLEFLK